MLWAASMTAICCYIWRYFRYSFILLQLISSCLLWSITMFRLTRFLMLTTSRFKCLRCSVIESLEAAVPSKPTIRTFLRISLNKSLKTEPRSGQRVCRLRNMLHIETGSRLFALPNPNMPRGQKSTSRAYWEHDGSTCGHDNDCLYRGPSNRQNIDIARGID